MKTDYTTEIEHLITNTFSSSTKENEKATPKTLEEIYNVVVSVLPAKWIYQTDVYTALQNLNFTTSYGKKTDKENSDGLYYFVILKS